MAKIIFGCGYLGRRVARLWLAAGEQVYVLTRSEERAKQLADEGLHPLVGDLTEPLSLPALPQVGTALVAVGFDRNCGKTIREVYVDGLRNALGALDESLKQLIYISSTGVFSQRGGRWVDENSPCRPTREGGKACLAAEELLRAHALGQRAVVLRLAGLYGPGRIPAVESLRRGEPLDVPADGYLNLIHVDDAARIVVEFDRRPPPERLYLVSDGCPVLRSDYFSQLARLLSAPPPQFTAASPDTLAAQRAASSKRICNRRMVEQIGVALEFPSYREGLAACVP